jgi:hypothetical protein
MGVKNLYHVKIYPTTQTLHSKPSISAMLTSLLPSEGFYDFSKIKFLQQLLEKNFFQALSSHSYEVAILTKFYKTLTSHKSLI